MARTSIPEYRLMRGDTLLGLLVLTKADQPFFHCSFEATGEFEAIRPLFEDDLRLMDEIDSENEDWSSWDANYDKIQALGLRLVRHDRDDITMFLLHIDGERAWFRY